MKKTQFLLAALMVCALPLFGQNERGTIVGIVIDGATKNAMPYSTVSIFDTEQQLVAGGITDDAGAFALSVLYGSNYSLRIEFISYEAVQIQNIVVDENSPTYDVGTVTLQLGAKTLNEIEVRAEKSQLQMSLDKKVFNVGKDLANQGGTAADVLDNVPSVSVDVDGNVSLRGVGNVRILVDGKPSGLVGFGEGNNGLRQIPSNLIDRIEVVTNPSARYDAEGMTGIINIILKKDQQKGVNGSVDLTAGYPDNYGVAVNMNYRKNKINLFANVGVAYQKGPGGGKLYQEFYRNDTTFILQETRTHIRGGFSANVRLGLDYNFSPTSVLTGSLSYKNGEDNNVATLKFEDFLFDLNNPTAISRRTDEETELESNLEYALNYKKTFKKEGHQWTGDVQFSQNAETENSEITEQFFTAEDILTGLPDLLQRSVNAEDFTNWLIQTDYIYPFQENGKLEAGVRLNLRDINNDFNVSEYRNNEWQGLAYLSNTLHYDENVYAAYAMAGNKTGKFSYQLGLRLEHSNITTNLLQTSEINSRRYTNLFPSVNFAYELKQQNTVQISYSRRIRRPSFWELNPFLTFSNARNFFAGNPNLNPEFTHSFEVGHIKYWDKASLTTAAYYRQTSGIIERLRTIDVETGNTVVRPENLAVEDAFGVELTFSYDPFKWWRLSGDANFFRSITDGRTVDPSLFSDTYTWFGRLTSRLNLWKFADFQIRANYRAPRLTPQGETQAMFYMDLGLSKDILNNNATLTLAVSDLFNSQKRFYTQIGDNFFSDGEFQRRVRQINLTFSYRLNQRKERPENGKREGGEGGGMEF